jgi:Zn-dependent protease
MPPLDGSKILMVLLPPKYADSFERVGIFGLFLVFILISLFGGVLFGIVSGLFKLISGSEVWGVFITILSQGL